MHIRNYANQLLNRRNWRASRSQPAYASFCCSLRGPDQRSANPSPLPPCPPNKTFAPRLFGEIAEDGSSCDEEREPGELETILPFSLSLSLLSFSFNRGRGRGRLEYDAWDVKSSKRSPGISCGQRFLRGSVIEDGCETSPVCKTRMSLSPGRHPALPRRGSHRSSLARRREQLLLSCPYPTTLQLECRGVTPEKNASLTNYAGPGYTLVCQHSPLPPRYFAIARNFASTRCVSLSLVTRKPCALRESLLKLSLIERVSLSLSFLFALFNASSETGIGPPAPPFSLVENLCSSSCSFDERKREGGEAARNTIRYLGGGIGWQVGCKALEVDWGRRRGMS